VGFVFLKSLGTSDHPRAPTRQPEWPDRKVDNLYVAGSSIFPCARHANPTLTVVALALRLTEHLESATTRRAA
jgi:choline dehydrogenase-like flavoprotein